ncbi:MAG TPA: nuclear transport factor 2 family protein [Gemmatimonadaceae bacterium]|nr:nuclear transport factor 2 family protein [Gemmatimonadaceae bacterium]
MRSTIRLTVLCLVLPVGMTTLIGAVAAKPEAARSHAHPDSAAVASVVNEFHEALGKGDSTAALSLLASDAVILESGGIETRSEYRSHHLSGDIQFARAVKSVRNPIKVVVAGQTAWTVSTSTTQGDFNGRAINSTGAESMVLSRGATGWKIRSIHWSSRNRRPAS